MKKNVIRVNRFFGHDVSDYGIKNGYVDYGTLTKAFDMVLNNDIIKNTYNIGEWETVNGSEFYYYNNDTEEYLTEEEYYNLTDDEQNSCDEIYSEIYQYYIISQRGFEILQDWTNEIVFYNDTLNMYVLGVTHFGTSWDYVLTNIKIENKENTEI